MRIIKRIIIRGIILIIILLSSIYGMNYIKGYGKSDVTVEMSQATLPLVYVQYDDYILNTLHGYTGKLQETLMRDTIIPIDGSKTVTVLIEQFKNKVKEIKYELRSINNSSLIETGKIEDLQKNESGYKEANIKFRMNLKENVEYSLKLIISINGGIETSYYTRVRYSEDYHTLEQLEFVMDFHHAIFDKELASNITKYLEPKPEKINNNLNYVDIYSSFEMITWAGLNPKIETNVVPIIKEIGNDIASIELNYIISAKISETVTEYYNVKEFYRVRWTQDRMYLLKYQREQEEIFNHRLLDASKNQFKIGISSYDIEWKSTEDSKKVAFVREGVLWYYDYAKTSITKVFSFKQDDLEDVRSNYNQYNIKIMNLEESGEITFAVYGYMNRGNHEGETGIALYHFYQNESCLEELLFIPIEETYQTMKEDVERLLYLNDNNKFFFIHGEAFYRVDILTKDVKKIVDQISKESLVVAGDYNIVAIQNEKDLTKCNKISIMNLDTETIEEIKADNGKLIKNIGFISSDLIYGISSKENIKIKENGTILFPMEKIYIVDMQNNIKKKYYKENIYILDATVNGNVIELKRYKKNGSEYEEIVSDSITSKEETVSDIVLGYTYNSERYNELYIKFPSYIYATSIPKLKLTKETLIENVRTNIMTGVNQNRYYVYANGEMLESYETVTEAIQVADQSGGVVVNSKKKYIWEKNGKNIYATVGDVDVIKASEYINTKVSCISMILNFENIEYNLQQYSNSQETIDTILSEYLPNGGVNLSGCNFDIILYYITKEAPVIAMNQKNEYIILTSYNSTTLRYIEANTGEIKTADINKMQKEFEDMGNIFYSYIK